MSEEPRDKITQSEDSPMSWLDRQFVNASTGGVVVLSLIFNAAAVLLGIIGLIVCKNKKARERALAILICGLVVTVVGGIAIAVMASKG